MHALGADGLAALWNRVKSLIPAKMSELENDAGYISEVPAEYVTETELDAKGYLTEHQDLSSYALKTELPAVPTVVSAFTNDAGYATNADIANTASRVIVADTNVRSFPASQLDQYASPGHVEHWSIVANCNDYKTGDICLLKAYNTSNGNQKVYIVVVALYPTSSGGLQGLSLGYAPVEWT